VQNPHVRCPLLIGSSFAGKSSKLGNLCSKISKYHYPDRLHKAILINCPGMINQMWGLAKNMLDENARQRTSLFTKKDTKKVRLHVLTKYLYWHHGVLVSPLVC
jgi:CRAL/TRIO domain